MSPLAMTELLGDALTKTETVTIQTPAERPELDTTLSSLSDINIRNHIRSTKSYQEVPQPSRPCFGLLEA